MNEIAAKNIHEILKDKYMIYTAREKKNVRIYVRKNIKSILKDDVNINKTRDISPIGRGKVNLENF